MCYRIHGRFYSRSRKKTYITISLYYILYKAHSLPSFFYIVATISCCHEHKYEAPLNSAAWLLITVNYAFNDLWQARMLYRDLRRILPYLQCGTEILRLALVSLIIEANEFIYVGTSIYLFTVRKIGDCYIDVYSRQ